MNEITFVNQTGKSIRIFSIGSHRFFIEDWNKIQNEPKQGAFKKEKK